MVSLCGHSAHHVLALGITAYDPRKFNFEVFMFRDGATIYTLFYTFHASAPDPDAEGALTALCPPAP